MFVVLGSKSIIKRLERELQRTVLQYGMYTNVAGSLGTREE